MRRFRITLEVEELDGMWGDKRSMERSIGWDWNTLMDLEPEQNLIGIKVEEVKEDKEVD
jgi:hypothetical protein